VDPPARSQGLVKFHVIRSKYPRAECGISAGSLRDFVQDQSGRGEKYQADLLYFVGLSWRRVKPPAAGGSGRWNGHPDQVPVATTEQNAHFNQWLCQSYLLLRTSACTVLPRRSTAPAFQSWRTLCRTNLYLHIPVLQQTRSACSSAPLLDLNTNPDGHSPGHQHFLKSQS